MGQDRPGSAKRTMNARAYQLSPGWHQTAAAALPTLAILALEGTVSWRWQHHLFVQIMSSFHYSLYTEHLCVVRMTCQCFKNSGPCQGPVEQQRVFCGPAVVPKG